MVRVSPAAFRFRPPLYALSQSLSLLLAYLATVAPFALGQASDGVWSNLSPQGLGPSARFQHGSVYDQVNDRMIVFGGAEALADAWSLSLGTSPQWTGLPSGPARKAMAVIVDPVRRRLVMFGGYDNSYRNDVWTLNLDGAPIWTQLQPSGTPPSGRMLLPAIYDPVRDRMIVFGGHPPELNDVWGLSLSTNAWTQIIPQGVAPSPRYGPVAVYDPLEDRMIVFGGTTGGNEVWALSLSGTPTWSQLVAPGGPSARSFAVATYDRWRQRMLLYGGYNGTRLGDLWALNLSATPTWQELYPSGALPSGRSLHSAVYEEAEDRMVVFGGEGPSSSMYLNDVWAFTPTPVAVVPNVTGFEPMGGLIGDPVTIQGTGLNEATDVRFNGVSGAVLASTFWSVTTQVPPGATTGPIQVVTSLGEALSAQDFFVGERPVVVEAIPDSGKLGNAITLYGRHFTGTIRVAFGGLGDATFQVVADSILMATVDGSARSGPISVTTPAATGTSGFTFKVLPPDTSARIASIRDVPADQGGRVVVSWLRSDLDLSPQRVVTGYRVWRRAPIGTASEIARPTWRRQVTSAGEVVFWEPLTVVPSAYLDGYAYLAPTTQDSTAAGNPYTAFFIQTLTEDPFAFYGSPIDSGYSVDNLPPQQPLAFAWEWLGRGSAILTWQANEEPDLVGYVLHRGLTPDFEPNSSTLIAETKGTSYVDQGTGRDSYYRLAALDIHGNLSSYALTGRIAPASSDTQPRMLAVLPIRPNPLTRGDVVISFTLATSAPARLELWDIAGRRLEERDVSGSPGQHAAALGRVGALNSGLYLVRLSQEGRTVTRALTVLR